ncbi:MAG: permease [Fimbriiglobus sp.]|nr:permease [Fimbriiglobus sp.]
MELADILRDFVLNFLSIVWEALPFIILGALIAGVLEELLPQQALSKLLPKHFLPAVLIGGALGLVFPMCECGIVVVMRRLLKKGLPLSCCIAYMLAGPILNPIVLGSTAVAFFPHGTDVGWTVLLMRAGLGYLVACVTGLVVHFLVVKWSEKALLTPTALPPAPQPPKGGLSLGMIDDAPSPAPAAGPKKSVAQRLANISSTALNDFIDITVFLIIGSLLSALVKSDPNLIGNVELMSRENPVLAIPLLMLLAFVLCLCSEADAFLAASFTTMSLSAKLAFLVYGPMLDIKLLLMYTRVFRWRLIGVIVACVFVQVLVYTLIAHVPLLSVRPALAPVSSVAPAPMPN